MTSRADSNDSDLLDPVIAEYLQKAEAGAPQDRDALVAAGLERARAFSGRSSAERTVAVYVEAIGR